MGLLRTLTKWLRRGLRAVFLSLAAVVLFIEEVGWRPLTAWMARLASWPPLGRLEARIRQVRPFTALLLFLVPAVLLFPVKLLALWFIHLGRASLGIAVIVLAKVLGTALVGRLFVLTEPQLMHYSWFARALAWWRATKLRVKAWLLESSVWRALQGWRRRGRLLWRRLAGRSRDE